MKPPATPTPPCVLFEDAHLLVAHKPAGMNTHAPAPFAGEGLYDWLRHREARWADLATIHRLDKETSGVIAFARTPLANRSLTDQFARHLAVKKYRLLTDRPVARDELVAVSDLARVGERYVSRPPHAGGNRAETRFRVIARDRGRTLVEAQPVTGRTHQIRVHAAEHGFPILGDSAYGGTPWSRLCLHAESLRLRHPATGTEVEFVAPADFSADARLALRQAIIDPAGTNALRLIHGASDGWPGWYVDRLGDFFLSQSERALTTEQREWLAAGRPEGKGVYHKLLRKQAGRTEADAASPQWVLGEMAPERFAVRENGLSFELGLGDGYSVGLFLDQRDNRRRLLTNHVAKGFSVFPGGPAGAEVLNTFAYTCGFSVSAARAGARTTSLDLSKKYLEWGRRNFELNGIDASAHEFIFGDTFDWMRRLAKKGRTFDVILLDPPTFSQSKESGLFRAEKDYGKLVATALPLLKPGGVLFASTNAATLAPEAFLKSIESAAATARRKIAQRHYAPQPPDFPITRAEPAYLKTVWLRLD